jgi:sugar lactone lactonase YvrE
MALDFETPAGGVLRVDPGGGVREILQGLVLGNGIGWSPDDRTLYVADSLRMTVEAIDVDADGEPGGRRELIRFPAGSGAPNGIAVDADGVLWVALTGGGRVRAVALDGTPVGEVEIGTPGATSCAFGGSDNSTLFITSRSGRMPEAARRVGMSDAMMDNPSPVAGGVFACRPGPRGRPVHRFAG